MRPLVLSWMISRIAVAVAAILVCGVGSASAGDGGGSLTTIQAIIGPPDGSSGFCKILNMNPCPQLPTVTQAILEAAALGLSPPEMVAAQNSIPPGSNVQAGNPAAVPPTLFVPTPFPLNSTTSPTLSDQLSTLTPLAFVNSGKNSQGTPAATQLYDPDADTFLYTVTVSSIGFATPPGGTVPDTLYLFYDNLARTNSNFSRGQTVAKFSFPLTVLNSNGTERAVPTTLQFIAPTTDCSASKAIGDFLGSGTPQTVSAAAIGLNCAVVFGPSPTSAQRHATFEVAIPLVVTGANPPPNTDPAYFYFLLTGQPGPINIGLFTAFLFDDLGFAPSAGAVLPTGASIGIGPTAGPLGAPPSCTGSGCIPPASTLALCASLPPNGNGQALVPVVGAYYAIATDGETLLSAALPASSTSVCPKL